MSASLVLFGPTASGKSSLAMELARRNRGEIINMDSMQIYKGMDVGTAKPLAKEREEIPHHLFDLVEPHEEFSAVMYKELALETIKEIQSRGNNAILVGGTGLYLSALYYDYSFRPQNHTLKEKYRHLYEEEGLESLQKEAELLYPSLYSEIDRSNPHRLLRLLESQGQEDKRQRSSLELDVFLLEIPPEVLNQRIEERVKMMMQEGLLEEVKKLYERYGDVEYLPALKGIGYKEFYPYLRGEISLEDAMERQIIHTRQYAKRQRTWGRNQYTDIHKLDAEASLEEKVAQVEKLWRKA